MDLAAALEALFYVIDEPLKRERLRELYADFEPAQIDEALGVLMARYAQAGCGLQMREVAGGYQISTRPEYGEQIREFLRIKKRMSLSKQALETLAIIAYEQPITTPEIREIRGYDPSGVIRTLLHRKLIRIAGRKEVIGRPMMYASTDEFLIQFDLNTLDDLPKPEEFVNLIDDNEDDEFIRNQQVVFAEDDNDAEINFEMDDEMGDEMDDEMETE